MLHKKFVRSVIGFCAVFLLVACSPTQQATLTSAFTVVPATATSYLVETETPERPPSPSVRSTIDPAFQKEYVMQLLKGEAHACQLPCLWDIQPGESNFEDVEDIFGPVVNSLTLEDRRSEEGIYLAFTINDFEYVNLFVDFVGNSQGIKYIRVRVNAFPPEHPYFNVEFSDVLRQYFVRTVLLEFGPPSRILLDNLAGGGGPGPSFFYILRLYYDDIGVLFEYVFTDGIKLDGNTVTLCPDYKNLELFTMVASSPDDPRGLTGVVGNYKNLEHITDFSIEEFTQLFTSSTDSVCFESFTDR